METSGSQVFFVDYCSLTDRHPRTRHHDCTFFTTKVSSLISVEGGKAISLSLNEKNIPNT